MRYTIGHGVQLETKRGKRRLGIIIFVFVLSAIIVVRILTAPAKGHQTAVTLRTTQVATPAAKVAAASTLSNTYFSDNLPAGYAIQPGGQTPANLLYTQNILVSSDLGTLIVSVGVSSFGGNLSDNSSYELRANNPGTYQITHETISGEPVMLTSRIDGLDGEVVAFWPHGSYLATIGVTNGSTSADPTLIPPDVKVAMTILNNWQWK